MRPVPPLTLPDEQEVALAKAGLELLEMNDSNLVLCLEDKSLTLSAPMVGLVRRMFEAISQGKGVGVVSLPPLISLHEAAEVLNVSPEFVNKLLDEGGLPYQMVGDYRRMLLKDLLENKAQMRLRSEAAMRELTRLSQELGLYDELPIHLQSKK